MLFFPAWIWSENFAPPSPVRLCILWIKNVYWLTRVWWTIWRFVHEVRSTKYDIFSFCGTHLPSSVSSLIIVREEFEFIGQVMWNRTSWNLSGWRWKIATAATTATKSLLPLQKSLDILKWSRRRGLGKAFAADGYTAKQTKEVFRKIFSFDVVLRTHGRTNQQNSSVESFRKAKSPVTYRSRKFRNYSRFQVRVPKFSVFCVFFVSVVWFVLCVMIHHWWYESTVTKLQ